MLYLQFIKIEKDLNNIGYVWRVMKDEWRVPKPKLIISVTGGAISFENTKNKELSNNFKNGLFEAAAKVGEKRS